MIARLAVPVHFVMLGSVYRLTEDAATLTHVPRAGLMPTLLYRVVFDWAPPGHTTLATVNTVCALATLPLPVAWLARGRPPAMATAALAVCLALLPVLVTDARTESHLLPAMLWLWAGLLLLDDALTAGRLHALAGAVVLLVMAAWSRPELTVMAPLLAALTAWRCRTRRPFAIARPWLVVAWAVGGALWVPQLLHLQRASAIEQASGSIPRIDTAFLLHAPGRWLTLALPLQPLLFPMGITVLAVAALCWPRRRLDDEPRVAQASLLAAAALWIALTLVDLPQTSVPRLHAPAAVLVCAAGAWTLGRLWQATHGRRRWWWIAVVAVVASASPAAWTFARRTNEDDNAAWLDAAFSRLPTHGACLVALGMGDGPSEHRVQRALPDYLLRAPYREVTRYAFADWQRMGRPQCAQGTFLLTDQRCYALHRDARTTLGRPSPGLLAECRDILAAAPWQPLLHRHMANRGDNEYGYYGALAGFDVGLYRMSAAPSRR